MNPELLAVVLNTGTGLLGLIVLVMDVIANANLLGSNAPMAHWGLWIVVILLFPFLGVVGYYFFGRVI